METVSDASVLAGTQWSVKQESHYFSGGSVKLAARDYKSLQKASLCGDVKNPKLVHEYGKFYLEFPVKYRTKQYPDLPLDRQLAIGCDLGLTNGAVLSAVDSRGSVHGRWFSPFKGDMARIDHTINLIRKYAALSGKGQSLAALYTKLEGLKDNYVKQLSRWIVNRAIDAGAYCIVLEHLGRMRGRGALAARTHHWCTARIRDYKHRREKASRPCVCGDESAIFFVENN